MGNSAIDPQVKDLDYVYSTQSHNHAIAHSKRVFFFLRSSRLRCGTDGWNDAIHFYLVVERRDRESESEILDHIRRTRR